MLEKYRLELHWGGLDKKDVSRVELSGAYFCGPALKDAEKINDSDTIRMDFTHQFSRIVSSYYFADLFWEGVGYRENFVYLSSAYIKSDFIYDLNDLSSSDYIIIDTSQHDGERHVYYLVYESVLVNSDGVKKKI